MSERTLSISDARRRFLELIRGFAESSDRWIITKDGTREAVLLGYEDYEALMRTLDILGGPSLVEEIKRREREIKQGGVETKTHHQVFGDTE